ncbi:MAG TPA: GNAT family N-acetyltransferase [Bradyrhizobium sp.]|uniref:GNAT family N-acetyltransferase n=1 Tax=Bradyrhizobium sp. TaxID=376 RepID=UPI002D80C231|nr:GNAT family N-acetyltransferase [Bradyrhizobium sp.]HET7889203.1 GNAT family N-acetyltransferase [Bradyrhizobium sp.]
MSYQNITVSAAVRGIVRTLCQQEELVLLRDHLLRLDHQSRHDRFHGFMDDSFIERYAEKCANDGTVIIAYLEDGVVRGAAELHPPATSSDLPEIAFSVERGLRRLGVGSLLFQKLIEEAHARGYRRLRITTGAQNDAMRALANKFGAHLSFCQGESTGTIEVEQTAPPAFAPAAVIPIDAARAVIQFNRAYWKFWLGLYGWKQAA